MGFVTVKLSIIVRIQHWLYDTVQYTRHLMLESGMVVHLAMRTLLATAKRQVLGDILCSSSRGQGGGGDANANPIVGFV